MPELLAQLHDRQAKPLHRRVATTELRRQARLDHLTRDDVPPPFSP